MTEREYALMTEARETWADATKFELLLSETIASAAAVREQIGGEPWQAPLREQSAATQVEAIEKLTPERAHNAAKEITELVFKEIDATLAGAA